MSVQSAASEYDQFAAIYSRTMAEDFARRFLPVLERLLLRQLKRGAQVLDVCCGSGQMARMLSQQGFRVTGVDASEAMLELAREQAPEARFLCCEMTELGGADQFSRQLPPQSFDGALSTFNSLAHLENRGEICTVARGIRHLLRRGAPFVFDISTERSYRERWKGSFTLVEPEVVCVVRPQWIAAERTGRNDITIFCQRPWRSDGFWERTDLCIRQKCHPTDIVSACLGESGFEQVEVFDAERDLGMAGESGRAVFVAR